MSYENIRGDLIKENVPPIANAIELGAEAILKAAGNSYSNAVEGQPLTLPFLHSALAARLGTELVNNPGN